jgi:hypothetical protein
MLAITRCQQNPHLAITFSVAGASTRFGKM